MTELNRRSAMPVSADALSAWHFRDGALARLIPPWENARVISTTGPLAEGSRVVIELRRGPLRLRWHAVHDHVQPGRGFRDHQERGPFRRWTHEHRFLATDGASSELEDCIHYEEPLGAVGRWLAGGFIHRQLQRQFRFRHERTANDLRRLAQRSRREPRCVAISGATGLVGRHLVAFLGCAGDQVRRIVRGHALAAPTGAGETSAPRDIAWDPVSGACDLAALEGCDAVVHLAGENIAGGRWNAARRRAIRDSRVVGTRRLCEAIARMHRKPEVLVAASAVGYYGACGDELLDESAPPGDGFLAQTCREWEDATAPARDAGVRVVHLRIGIVIAAQGGVLPRLAAPFALGAGGPVGDGRQGMSWIALDDLLAAIQFAIDRRELDGAVNATAPAPLSNRDFGRCLASVLRRPFLLPLPAPAVRMLLGEMGQALLLDGAFVTPGQLLAHGFRFDFPSLENALRFELGRQGRDA